MARHTGGWVKVYRALINGDIGNNPYRYTLFSKLIGWANLQDSWVEWKGKPRQCPRGSLVTSSQELADAMNCTRDTVNRQLLYLQLRKSVIVEKSPHGLFIEIPNFDYYQGQDADDRQESDIAPTSSQHLADIQPTHNEERKNKRKKERKNTFAFSDDFERLSQKYVKLFLGTTVGTNALERFRQQFKTTDDIQDLDVSMDHYRKILNHNDWRQPKTTFETYLGTKRSGFFWRQFIQDPLIPNENGSPIDLSHYFDKEGA